MHKKNTVSITFLGTQHHRDTHRSVLVTAHDQINELATEPDSSVAAWLIDGPGCLGTPEHPMPGTYYYDETNGQKILDQTLADTQLRKFRTTLSRYYRAVTGEGIESSLLEATLYIKGIIAQNGNVLPSELNLQGFSRGADNCVRLANLIYSMYPSIKINLFLIDPVPGPGRRDDPESYYIPPNVQDCHMIMMLSEHHFAFGPQHRNRYVFTNPQTQVAINHLPGRHGAGISTKSQTITTPPESQILVQDALLNFNIQHKALPKGAKIHYHHQGFSGSRIEPEKLSKPRNSLTKAERFGFLCDAMQSHIQLSQRWEVSWYPKRRIFTDRGDYVLDSDLFLDQEHRDLFKAVFPATFNWFFEKNFALPGKKAYTKSAVFRELQILSQPPYTKFYDSFLKFIQIPKISSEQDIIDPQGVARIERPEYNQPLVSDELSYLQFCLQSIVDHYHYRIPSVWFYHRLVSSDYVFEKNHHSNSIALEIKQALQASYHLPAEQSKHLLKKLMRKVKNNPKEDFFVHEINKIIPDSKQYIDAVLETLQRYHALLPEAQANVVSNVIHLIQKQIDNSLKDHYQKRQRVQTYLVGLNTALHDLNRQSPNPDNFVSDQLFQNLNKLSQPSYAEISLLDQTISELSSYLYLRSFLSAFPFGQKLGLYNPENINLATDVLEKLKDLRDSETGQYSITRIESVLKEASSVYARNHGYEGKKTERFGFWKKHITFKADPLSKIIEHGLKRATTLSKLVFGVPKAPSQSLEQNNGLGRR